MTLGPFLRVGLACVVALAAGCSKTKIDQTTALVRIDSLDLAAGRDVDALDVIVRIGDQSRTRSYALSATGEPGVQRWPFAFGVTPLRESNETFSVEATAKRAGATVAATLARSRFLPGQVGVLELRLDKRCAAIACPEGKACQQGSCTLDVDRTLAPYDGATPADAGVDGRGAACASPAVCTVGHKRCGADQGVQSCLLVAGCPAWGSEVTCSNRQVCAGTAPNAGCQCPPAPAGCENGAGSACTTTGTLVSCAKDVDGCLYAKAPRPCGTGKPCAGAFPNAACTCPTAAPECNGSQGSFCSGNDKVTLCSPNSAGCVVTEPPISCPAGKPCTGELPVASCSCGAAPPECAAGAGSRCMPDNTLVRCGLDPATGCIKVVSSTPCSGARTCTGDAPNAACTCPTTPPECEDGAGRACLSGNVLAECTVDEQGCLQLKKMPCAAGQTCGGAHPTAACQCPAPPDECAAGVGGACKSSTELVTCGRDANDCVVVIKSDDCAAQGKTCAGPAGTATCACAGTPADCAGTGRVCRDGGTKLATCTTGANGCVTVATTSCPLGQTCSGQYPNASCGCPAAPADCPAAGGKICRSGTLVTCAADPTTGCVKETGTMSCAGGCMGPATAAVCCPAKPAACTGPGTVCDGSGKLVTCALDGNGCLVATETSCPAGKPCAGTFPAASCSCPAPPAGCASVGTVCRNTSTLATCGTDAGGCIKETGTMTCGGGCKGNTPSAYCCPTPPALCGGQTGKVCNGGRLYTCSLDAMGCLVQDAGVACSDGCANAACCPAKPAGCSGAGTVCSGSSVQTCSTVNGCLVASTSACPAGKPCGGSYPSAACTCASPPACTQGSCRTGSGEQLHRYNLGTACTTDVNGCRQTLALDCGSTQYCSGAPSNARCVDLITAGWPSSFASTTDTFFADEVYGAMVSVSQPIWVQRLGVIASTSSPVEVSFEIRGVDGNGNVSGSALHSQPMTLNNGVNEIDIFFEVPLSAGDVFLLIQVPSNPGDLTLRYDEGSPLGSALIYSSASGVPYSGKPLNIYIRGTPQ